MDCPCCDGTGGHSKRTAVDDYDERDCSACDGTGKLDPCDHCDGTTEIVGRISGAQMQCPKCWGRGHDPIVKCSELPVTEEA